MLRKILAVVLLVASLSAFLVVFGGFALLDITIKLMWLTFSSIVAFAASSLGVNLSQNLVNKLLQRQKLVPGNLKVTESPIITKDKITLCNLIWVDEDGIEKLSIHRVELRTTLMALFLALFHSNREERLLVEIKEIILQQPQLSLSYQLKDPQQLQQDLQKASPELLSPAALRLPKQLKLYIERGTLKLRLNGQLFHLENIHGVWRNEPVAYHYLSCQLDDENITLQNQNGLNRYLIRANKLPLKQFWPLLHTYVQLDKLDFIDGELTDCKAVLEYTSAKCVCRAISWQVNDLSINSNGLLIEDIEGKFSSLDLALFQIKKLDCNIDSHNIRLNGTVNLLPPGEKGCIYKLRLRSDKLFLKSNIDVNIFDGFQLQGFLRQENRHLLAGISIDGQIRLDLPNRKALKISQFAGTVDLFEGILVSKASTCYINSSFFSLEDSLLNLQTEDFLIHLVGDGHEISLLLDEPIKGLASFNITVEGNIKKQQLQAYGLYSLQDFAYKFKFLPYTPNLNLNGRISYQQGCLLFQDNRLNLAGHSIPLPFTLKPLQQESQESFTLDLQDKLSDLKQLLLRHSFIKQAKEPPASTTLPQLPTTEDEIPSFSEQPTLFQRLKKHLPFSRD